MNGKSGYEAILRPLLFRLDPERVHNLALWAIVRGLVRTKLVRDPRLECEAFGLRFNNPLGLAAGFDKDGLAVSRWESLGFGFAELGTVTPRPQPGNPKPRLFRIPEERAIINRFGFNNDGARALACRLRGRSFGIPIGLNLGKNKETPDEQAPEDYALCAAGLAGLGDYWVINVSSPNTPGLRGLQDSGRLRQVIAAVQEHAATTPLLVKFAPDLDQSAIEELVNVALDTRLAGLVATNTTVRRDMLTRDPNQSGGLSGAPLRKLADEGLGIAGLAAKGTRLEILGVGGIFSGSDILDKLRLGAALAQVYTGWVYRGPAGAPLMLLELLQALKAEGIPSIGSMRDYSGD